MEDFARPPYNAPDDEANGDFDRAETGDTRDLGAIKSLLVRENAIGDGDADMAR